MSKIIWDKTGERLYETGCDHGVLYPMQTGGVYNKGVAWNGLTAVTESPSGAEASPIYADNIKYVNLVSNEEFGATVEAYMYPGMSLPSVMVLLRSCPVCTPASSPVRLSAWHIVPFWVMIPT